MSALPPKADICSANTDVRYGPKADMPALAIRIVLAIVGAFQAVMPNTRHHHTEPNRLLACFGKQWHVLKDFPASKMRTKPMSLFLRSDSLFIFCKLMMP